MYKTQTTAFSEFAVESLFVVGGEEAIVVVVGGNWGVKGVEYQISYMNSGLESDVQIAKHSLFVQAKAMCCGVL